MTAHARITKSALRSLFRGVLLCLAACGEWEEAKLDPPAEVQLICSPTQRGASPEVKLVFLLDTGKRTASWVNGPNAPEGRLEISDNEYHLLFEASPSAHASLAKVNRYDGVMEREFGLPPFLQPDGKVTKGNVRQTWLCKHQPGGQRF